MAWKNYITLMVGALLLSACNAAMIEELSETNALQQFYKPVPWGMAKTPEGTPDFKQGWEDGCSTGLGAYGNGRYRAAYGWKQDHTKVSDADYYRAWKDAYTYCRWYVYGWARPQQGE